MSIAIASLVAFAVAAVAGALYLRTRREKHDEISSAAVGIGLGLAVLVVLTGSIWAKASWGTWWVWGDPRLVTFLIVLLLYGAYLMLRSSVDGERRMRYSSIYAIAAFASVPLSFYSVRIAESFVHPVVFSQNGADMPGSMLVWYVVSQVAVLGIALTALLVQLSQRRAEKELQRVKLRLQAELCEVGSGTQYVVAAHAVIVAALLLYVVVVALRSARIAREAELLARLVEEDRARREAVAEAEPEPVKVDAS